ncbi:MAG: GerW family sporulation protein [Oscillospiraceae bacterium]|nr:GerW family sporulation protein [Oscillospiraceae bacterium]
MNEHPIKDLMDVTLQRIKDMADSNTIIGEAIHASEGTMIIPVSKVSYGFASGGSDFPSKTTRELFGGGGGAGLTIQPVAFLVIKKNGDVKMLQLAEQSNNINRIINMVPEVMDTVTGLINKDKPDVSTDKTTATTAEEVAKEYESF